MKFLIAIIAGLLFWMGQTDAQEYFYYFSGERIILDLNQEFALVQLSEGTTESQLQTVIDKDAKITKFEKT